MPFSWNLDCDSFLKNTHECDAFQVRGLPTVFFISPDPNKDAIRTEGLIPIQMMRDIIDKDMWNSKGLWSADTVSVPGSCNMLSGAMVSNLGQNWSANRFIWFFLLKGYKIAWYLCKLWPRQCSVVYHMWCQMEGQCM